MTLAKAAIVVGEEGSYYLKWRVPPFERTNEGNLEWCCTLPAQLDRALREKEVRPKCIREVSADDYLCALQNERT
jgi:hypothetical protein